MAKKKVIGKKDPKLPIDDEGQVTPTGDALAEIETVSVGAATALGKVAALLQSAGAFNQGGALFRDSFDTDVGFHESLRISLANRMASLSALGMVSDLVLSAKAMDLQGVANARSTNAEVLSNFENNANSFFGMITKSNTVAQSALTQSESLQTNNEVLTNAQLSEMVKLLSGKMSIITDALEAINE
jgi:hypothetical protein